jgi:pimeloyl-ACP methyl ester carboxylesterase
MPKSIIILHGWGSDLKKWQPLKDLLQKQGFKVFLPKLPNQKPMNTADYADWLNQHTKKINQFYLIGHSFGGQIAINFTAQYPQKVSQLILINSAGIRKKISPKRIIFRPIAKLGKLIFSLPLIKSLTQPAKKLLYKATRESDYLKASPIMKQTLTTIVKEDQQANLKKIKTPTLILWAAKDKFTPLSQGKLIAKLIANSTLEIYPHATHGLPFHQPQAVAKKILWFISSN